MSLAIREALKAEKMGEVPVGAVLVSREEKIIGYGHNQPISLCDPTGHAEILALRMGAKNAENYRLPDTTMYVTLEPCIMCMAAIIHARVRRLVFGASDEKGGGAVSLYNLPGDRRLNHRVDITAGIFREESQKVLKNFFKNKRSTQCQM